MLSRLEQLKSVQDIKKMKYEELPMLAQEIRDFLIQSVSETGGHLASNLGVVELTLALHYVFDSPQDKIIWDVGHQSYVHKILTGRMEGFKSLRQLGGMSGFPKRKESIHDVFETGHSTTSISAALGFAAAMRLKKENHHAIAVIGDGALTGGMAYEALNNAGRLENNLIVILNDNDMSIAQNVGGMSKYLTRLRSTKKYLQTKENIESMLHHVPVVGDTLVQTVKRTKEGLKTILIQDTFFEEMGMKYLGPINGHSFEELIYILENAKEMGGPVLVHIKTEKGKGYEPAEKSPCRYHGVSPFDVDTGEMVPKKDELTFSKAFGEAMCKVAEENSEVIGITAAMPDGTGLVEFSKRFKRRFFDVGIAESHAVTFAAGLAADGFKPVVAIYSTFLQRAFDQILHDVCLQNLPIVFAIDRAGLVGEDGATHQGIYDLSYLSMMPNLKVVAPKAPNELLPALQYALAQDGPVAIRYPRGGMTIESEYINNYKEVGLKTLEKGKAIAILGIGNKVDLALKVRKNLQTEGLDCAVLELPQLYPLNIEELLEKLRDYEYLFTIEDNIRTSGFGAHLFTELKMNGLDLKGYNFGYPEGIIEHGDVPSLLKEEHVSEKDISEKIRALL